MERQRKHAEWRLEASAVISMRPVGPRRFPAMASGEMGATNLEFPVSLRALWEALGAWNC